MAPPDRPRARDDDRARDRDGNHERHGRRDHSRSPRRERGGRRSEKQRYRSRSPLHRNDRDRDRQPEAKGRDRDGRPPTGPRGDRAGGRDVKVEREPVAPPPAKPKAEAKSTVPLEKPEGLDDETWEIVKVMGFGAFKTTKETKVPGNDKNYGVRKDKKMEARQYMNRQGGFNRPLSPGR